jgi:hypothetical protein
MILSPLVSIVYTLSGNESTPRLARVRGSHNLTVLSHDPDTTALRAAEYDKHLCVCVCVCVCVCARDAETISIKKAPKWVDDVSVQGCGWRMRHHDVCVGRRMMLMVIATQRNTVYCP